jgi:O-antigen/teichoic acid export membrane protein
MTSNLAHLIKNSLSVFGTRVILILISIVGSIIVARILGPANRGVMEILLLVPLLLVNFGNLGIGNANLYFTAKGICPSDKVNANSLSITLMLGGILFVIGHSWFNSYKETLFRGIPGGYIYLVLSAIPWLLFQKFTQYSFLGKEDVKTRNIIVLTPAIVNIVLTIILVVVVRLDLFGVLAATLISNVIAGLLCYYFLSRESKVRLRFHFKLFLESVKFGLIPFLALLVMNLNYRADMFLVKYYLNDTAVGLYGLGVSIVEKIWLLPEAIGIVLFARVSRAGEGESSKLTPVICRLSILVSAIMGVMLFCSADYIVPVVYGKQFKDAVQPLLVLLPGVVAMTIFLVLNGHLTGQGKAKVTLYIFSGSLILNVGLNMILIPQFGISGAALASTVSYSLGAFCLGIAFVRMNRIGLTTIFVPKKEDYDELLVPLLKGGLRQAEVPVSHD